jgi:hypothetical protein
LAGGLAALPLQGCTQQQVGAEISWHGWWCSRYRVPDRRRRKGRRLTAESHRLSQCLALQSKQLLAC